VAKFAKRVVQHFVLALLVVVVALGIGVSGYHYLAELNWIDSFLNASMILGGMGPVDPLHSEAAKIFAACYALFSGLVFIGIASLMVAPFAHRLLHRFHIDHR
jgi:putative effector of murein hydrolase